MRAWLEWLAAAGADLGRHRSAPYKKEVRELPWFGNLRRAAGRLPFRVAERTKVDTIGRD